MVTLEWRAEKSGSMPKQTFLNLPEDKRQWILDCAIDEFSAHGYAGASISRIVAEAKIAKGSFYQYFEDKDDLYAYLIERTIISQKIRISDEESEKLAHVTLTEFLRMMLKRMTHEFCERPKILKIGIDLLTHRHEPVYKNIVAKYAPISDDYFQAFIREEKKRGEIDANVDDDILSHMLTGAHNEIVNRMLDTTSQFTPEYIDAWTDKVEYILTNGIYKNTTHDGE